MKLCQTVIGVRFLKHSAVLRDVCW